MAPLPPKERDGEGRSCHSCEEHVPIFFFYIRTFVHYEFVPQGKTVNQHYYTDTMHHLQENVQQKQHEN
jgi:hypothetical protein